MTMKEKNFPLSVVTLSVLAALQLSAANANETAAAVSTDEAALQSEADTYKVETVLVTAERALKQSSGASLIGAEDLNRTPVRNDVSELIRTMPGVNLTGNTASGERGNNRQIDIRGMGPENTLIMIDGRPVTSRNSVRFNWRGERDTRGDSNWVPAEAIESIEVLRGVSAARYGSGAMGGVVNIVTKKVTDEFHGWADAYGSISDHSDEGDSYRTGFGLSGPLVAGKLGYRLYGNYNKTEADDPLINSSKDVWGPDRNGNTVLKKRAAGREGVENRDIGARLAWQIDDTQSLTLDTSWSRQSNEYTGDVQTNNANGLVDQLAAEGEETNRMTRTSVALDYEGDWSWGHSNLTVSFDNTDNERLPEGLFGGGEGMINSDKSFVKSTLKSYRVAGEAEIPMNFGVDHMFTIGFETIRDELDDSGSFEATLGAFGSAFPGSDQFGNRDAADVDQDNLAFYIEDSFTVGDVNFVPTLRFDHNSDAGNNLSPGLSAFWTINENWSLKGGIARAFKAPNLYQVNPNYVLYSKGNGCDIGCNGSGGCYLVGNTDLDPETSINKEIGIEYQKGGFGASVTFFRNDYKNKIVAGSTKLSEAETAWVYRWENSGKAVVQGLEGHLAVPLHDTLTWTTNLTYMDKFESKETKNPLSVIPEYTINSMIDWTPNDVWSANVTFTQYGEREPRRTATNKADQSSGLKGKTLGEYSITSVSGAYKLSKMAELRFGIYNVFDKRILRDPDTSSAESFNEPGRSYYATVKFNY